MTSEQRLRVQKTQDLLKSLPTGATPALKREIVEAAFRAFDIPTQEILRAASAHIEAFNAFVAEGEKAKQQALDQGNARIKELERQIAEVRGQIDQAVAAQDARAAATRAEVARVEPILAFFNATPSTPPAQERPEPRTRTAGSVLTRTRASRIPSPAATPPADPAPTPLEPEPEPTDERERPAAGPENGVHLLARQEPNAAPVNEG